ncbi:MAG: bacteriohemerythrin [Spirochaetes bacterium]|nr:MAG: bacteriohemerythrin [Spirochaetota bacterium]
MPLISWDEKYSVGFDLIDEQHKRLFDLTNGLHDAVMVRSADSAMGRSLRDLVEYTVYHFAAEEELMRANNYPTFTEHKALHDALTRQAADFKDQVEAGKKVSSLAFMQFLREWLTRHIMEVDSALGAFLASKGRG